MSKRFKVIQTYLKRYSDGVTPTSGPIYNYLQVRSGAVKPVYAADTWPDKNGLKPIGVTSFLIADVTYLTSITNRTAELTNISELITAAAHADPADTTSPPKGWKPARAIVKVTSFATTPKTSEITKLSYEKPTSAHSYTVPFGKKNSTDTFMVQVGALAAKVPEDTTSDGWTLSVKSEIM